ncbi:MAG: hypothetical protein ACPGXK_06555 [Phycisphaerae bacterium]
MRGTTTQGDEQDTWARRRRVEWRSEASGRICSGTLLGHQRGQVAMIMRPIHTPPCGSSLLDERDGKRATIVRVERLSEVVNLITAQLDPA